MSSKKKQTPSKPAGARVIDFNALLGNWPIIRIGDIEITGRELSIPEAEAWLEAERSDNAAQQTKLALQFINDRGATVDMKWVQAQPRTFLRAFVKGLYGAGWPGEEEGAEGK